MSEGNVIVSFELLNNSYSISCDSEKSDLLKNIIKNITDIVNDNRQKYPKVSKEQLLIQTMINIFSEQKLANKMVESDLHAIDKYINEATLGVQDSLSQLRIKTHKELESSVG